MPLTQFPITTPDPTVDVTLPVGRHELELVVEDSAGLRSAPDTVVITVVNEPTGPVIRSISPTEGRIGSVRDEIFPITLSGEGLDGITDIQFLIDGKQDEFMSIHDRQVTPTKVTAKLKIDCEAAEDQHDIRVITEDQQGILVEGCQFTVLPDEAPTITSINYDFATCGDTNKVVTILGEHLACVQAVSFDRSGSGVTVVMEPQVPDEKSLSVKVSVESTAKPQRGNLVVTTRTDTATCGFEIRSSQGISNIRPNSGRLDWEDEVIITGTGLAGTNEKGLTFFTFPLIGEPIVDQGIVTRVTQSSDNEVRAKLRILSSAESEKHGFSVLANASLIKSWEQPIPVYFTVGAAVIP